MFFRGKDLSIRRWKGLGAALVISGSIGLATVRLTTSKREVPTARVRRGEFVDYMQLHGEVKALKSVTIAAPPGAGDLRIIKLARSGTRVKKGEVVVQFDASELRQELIQQRSILKQAEAEIEQARAQARFEEAQDEAALMKARYDLKAAKLEANKQEILSEIEGEMAKLKISDADQELHEAEEKLKSDQAAAVAGLQSAEDKRGKALFEMHQAGRNISATTLKAPAGGIVALVQNWRASDPFGGRSEFKEGDKAWAGAAIAELPDLSTLYVSARVDEAERGRLETGQRATVRVEALAGRQFAGRIVRISMFATTDFDAGWPSARNFTVEIGLDNGDTRLRPGMETMVKVEIEHVANSVLIPAEASFQSSGGSVAYVLRGSKFEERPIKIARRGNDQLLVAGGLNPGEQVALRDPGAQQ